MNVKLKGIVSKVEQNEKYDNTHVTMTIIGDGGGSICFKVKGLLDGVKSGDFCLIDGDLLPEASWINNRITFEGVVKKQAGVT